MRYVLLILFIVLMYGCASGEANKIPYKYRTPEQVKMECQAQIAKNQQSNANAGSDVGNILLGVMEGMQQDWACDPYK